MLNKLRIMDLRIMDSVYPGNYGGAGALYRNREGE